MISAHATGFARKSPIFARNRGLALSLVIKNLELLNNVSSPLSYDSCRTLKKKKHTTCQYRTKKNVIHRV